MRIRIAAIVLLLSIALLAPASASASSSIKYGVQDDAWLLYGPETPAQRIQILQRLGVDVVRLTLRWDAVAQSKPAEPRDPSDPSISVGSLRLDPATPARRAHQRVDLPVRDAGVGERRAEAELPAE
jgi:hypothetical protein